MTPRRPTPVQIAERNRQIAQWDAEHRRREEQIAAYIERAELRDNCVIALKASHFSFLFLTAIATVVGWGKTGALLAIVVVATYWLLRSLRHPEPWPVGPESEQPKPLSIIPFDHFENEKMLSQQGREDFSAACACPGCGAVDVHRITDEVSLPVWARVVRECDICARQWAQR